ncbi:indole-3-glycerol phosphate synthase [Natrialbaceae archaeon AArc-T1-2]|uniref:indole-3-glycerol phosphate synthase n=1 Tax=Natrialbaceae archaeon AArc-T1-2 TaxID=3053904 RepID=UPI00255A93C7|nr:indole-3-glycerol phosphate synthase [Natrialbaceae archaeon AArc-T1-2]WIV67793.1 indole-3-glycerol phosphate synthase [Natrialbaceae archaeon AArc-T1-2]
MEEQSAVDPAVASILEAARDRSGGDRIDVDARSFPDAIAEAAADGRVPVIGEVKPTSPTAEGTRTDDPVELATAMVDGGAAAISVLTEPTHFEGSPEALTRVRDAVDVPVLRKDFLLREEHIDVVEADLVLLIARFVDDLEGLVAAARDRGFQPLVEVHDVDELEAALSAGAEIVGVNNRDLTRLEVDLETFESVAPHVPDDVALIAESGISTPDDVRRMREAGADALLVGSAIMDHGGDSDVRENTRELTQTEHT